MTGLFGGFGVMSPLAWIGMLLVWAALVALALVVIRRFFPRDRRSAAAVARTVLLRRYAAGEISEAEYRQALKTLN